MINARGSPNGLKTTIFGVKIAFDIKLAPLARGGERKKRKDCTICSLRSHQQPKRKFYEVVSFVLFSDDDV